MELVLNSLLWLASRASGSQPWGRGPPRGHQLDLRGRETIDGREVTKLSCDTHAGSLRYANFEKTAPVAQTKVLMKPCDKFKRENVSSVELKTTKETPKRL